MKTTVTVGGGVRGEAPVNLRDIKVFGDAHFFPLLRPPSNFFPIQTIVSRVYSLRDE